MWLRFRLLVVVVVVAALGFAMAQEPVRGGTLRVGMETGIPAYDPHDNVLVFPAFYHLYLEALVGYDVGGQPVGVLADSWEAIDGGREWVFRIRQGVKFHDGTTLTADDVEASFDRYWALPGSRIGVYRPVESWEAIDDYTFVVRMSQPWGTFLETFGMASGAVTIQPRSVMERFKEERIRDWRDIVGTGPYRITRVVEDDVIRLERFEDYVSPAGEPNHFGGYRGQYVDAIELYIMEDAATRLAALMAGEIHIAGELQREDFIILERTSGIEPVVRSPGRKLKYVLNAISGPFEDITLRRAFQAAVDPAKAMSVVGPAALWTVDVVPRFQQGQWMWIDNIGDYYPADLELGRQLVAQSSYNGEVVRLMITPDAAVPYSTGVIIEETLRDLGLNVETVVVDGTTFRTQWTNWDFWDIKHSDGGSIVALDTLESSFAARDFTPWPVRPDEVEALLTTMRVEVDDDARREAVARFNILFAENAHEHWLGTYLALDGIRSNVRGYPPEPYMMFYNVWLDRE